MGLDPKRNPRRLKSVVVERIQGWILGDKFFALVGLGEVRMTDTEAFFFGVKKIHRM